MTGRAGRCGTVTDAYRARDRVRSQQERLDGSRALRPRKVVCQTTHRGPRLGAALAPSTAAGAHDGTI